MIASGGMPYGCKLIYMSDATYHLMIDYYYFDTKKDQLIADQWERKAIDRADAIIYTSNWAVEDSVSYYKADTKKVNMIPFPAYLDDYYKPAQKDGVAIKLLLVGVNWKRKGIDKAIEVVRELNRRQSEIMFELTVVGFMRPDNVMDECIHFEGKLNKSIKEENQRIIDCYSDSDIFILPTIAECSGIVFSEAAMYGLPVITHNTGGIGTYVEDGFNGYKLPIDSLPGDFADIILWIVKNGKLNELSENARKKYNMELNEDVWLEKFCNIVDSL